MTDESVAPPGDASATVTLPETHDDASDITPPGGSVKRGNQRLNIEKTWKFRFVTDKNNRHDQVSSAKVHLHWLQAVQEAFGNDIQIMTNKGKPLPKVDTVRWTERQHTLHFDVHHQTLGGRNVGNSGNQHRHASSNQKSQSSFIVHRVRTTVSLQEVKNTAKIYNLLREHKCYLTEHRWSEDVWDTTQLGFLLGLNPQYYDATQAQEKVMQDLKRNLPPRTKIPKFHMAFITPHIEVKNSVLRTKAYAFETEKTNSAELLALLKQAYRDTPVFIQFQMKSKHPEAYLRVILQQTKVLSGHHVIILQNIGSDAMYYLEEHIKAVDGVLDTYPTSKTNDDGRHKVLVQKKQFHAARTQLMEKLPQWFATHVELDAQQLNSKFVDAPAVAPILQDDLSSGENTYLSASVNTAMSYDTTTSDDFLNDTVQNIIDTSGTPLSSLVGQNLTWAQRANRGSITSRHSPKTQTVTTESQLTEDYMAELASSRAEVAELRTKLTGIEESKKSQQHEMELKAEKQRHELEMQMAQQQIEMERQSERQQRELETLVTTQRMEMEQQVQKQRMELEAQAQQQRMEMEQQAQQQRMDFERQLAEQRREFEVQSLRQQQQVQEQITNQINESLRQRPVPPVQTTETLEMTTFMAAQTRQMQMLTDMFARVINSNPQQHESPSQADGPTHSAISSTNTNLETHKRPVVDAQHLVLPPNGKRTATEIVDLTNDGIEETGATQTTVDPMRHSNPTYRTQHQVDVYQKRARKNTPIKTLHGNGDYDNSQASDHMADSDHESSFLSDLPSESHTPPQSPFHKRQLWSPIHESPPEYPDDPRHRYHIAMDDVGMLPDSQIDDDTLSKAPHVSPYEVTPGVLADEVLTDGEMQDILKQQHQSQLLEVNTPKAVHAQAKVHTELNTMANSPNQGDNTNPVQTKPGGQVTTNTSSC